jgi:hypothetical protein
MDVVTPETCPRTTRESSLSMQRLETADFLTNVRLLHRPHPVTLAVSAKPFRVTRGPIPLVLCNGVA